MSKWIVRLGETPCLYNGIKARAPRGMKLLGTVMRGAQFGVLAIDGDGSYHLLNGDHIQPLSNSQARSAIERAISATATGGERTASQARPAAPKVIVKRRRTLQVV
jgi:hypothetical protein